MAAMPTGRMMAFPLTLTHLWERARTYFPKQEIVSRLPDRSVHRQTYADFATRTAKLAAAATEYSRSTVARPGKRCAMVLVTSAKRESAPSPPSFTPGSTRHGRPAPRISCEVAVCRAQA